VGVPFGGEGCHLRQLEKVSWIAKSPILGAAEQQYVLHVVAGLSGVPSLVEILFCIGLFAPQG